MQQKRSALWGTYALRPYLSIVPADFVFVSMLILIPAVFLVLLRGTALSLDPIWCGAAYLTWLITLVFWLCLLRPTPFPATKQLALHLIRQNIGQILGISG